MHTHTLRDHPNFMLPRHFFAGAIIFTAAYFVTVSVNAQTAVPGAPDVVQMSTGGATIVTGTITEVDGNVVAINSGGTLMRINLDDVELRGAAEGIFKVGMDVTVTGEMKGNDFGAPIIKASQITAREIPAAAR